MSPSARATRETRPPRRARRPALVALVAGGALLGTALAGPAASAAASSAGHAVNGPSTKTATCTTSLASGKQTSACPRTPAVHVPAASTDKSTMQNTPGNLAQLVDTRTWTSGGGNTFPGADVPYGMVQWSPDTMPNRNAGGGYNYGDSMLTGYSLTHVSGPGCSAAGDVPILPMTGALPSGDPTNDTTEFTDTGEVAQAGYYSAESNLPNTITSQFTATAHSSMGEFTFPATTQADFLVKLMDSQTTDTASTAQVVGNNEIEGSDTTGDFCGESNQPYTVYFDVTFSQPFTASQVIDQSGDPGPDSVFLTFDTTKTQTIEAKVGISYVSTANAKLDWQSEVPGWNFNSVKSAAQSSWNSLLGKIQVSGGAEAQTQEFYSLLYKDFLQPNITSDVNGQYFGSDDKVHTVAGAQKNQYGIYSGWDIYHSESQLQAMLDPLAAGDQAQSQLNYYAQNGILQQWGYLNQDNWVMVGDPTDAIIADDYAFGVTNFDTATALKDMVTQATTVNDVRPAEAAEQQYGYIPVNGSYGCCNSHGQTASLLEYDNADFALSQYASALGDTSDATMLENRANNWANLFDTSTDLITPRLTSGAFLSGITPTSTTDYVEGDAYEYLWDVPNDYAGLFSLLGGGSKVAPELETYLSQPNGFGMYAQLTNEFDFGEQFALDYAGAPSGTQQAVDNIRNSMDDPGPDGLPNNDDLGANSSSFIWEMLGMYPENPGSGNLVFASPGFPKESITLPNGKKVSISAPGASPTEFYVKGLTVNGKAYNKLYIPYSSLTNGATMNWTLSTKATSWGSAAADAPPSYGPVYAATGSLSPATAEVQPGQSASETLAVSSTTSSAQTISWTVTTTSGSGVTVSPSSGTVSVPANGSASVPVTVTGGTTDGDYSVSFALSTAAGNALPADLPIIVAKPGDLTPFYNVTAISDDSDPTTADYDGDGFSYSAEQLAAQGVSPGGTVTSNGLTYTWPDIPSGTPNAIQAGGQTLLLSEPAGTSGIGFLGSATNAGSSGATGTVTVTYTDGTTSTATLGFSDWTLGAGGYSPISGDSIVATTSYRNGQTGPQTINTYLFSDSISVNSSKTVESVTLPASTNGGTMGIFAVGS
ncbi:MAG TPA: GH92 family glycosyl hydrolase [Actinocrinis sp.]|jgi:predicted alpha-1,2-mannosidase